MHNQEYTDEGVISLFDIWNKIVQYKKAFWCIFFISFITGSAIVLLNQPKYTFTQVIEIGKSPDEKGQNTINVDLDDTIKKIKKVFYPGALHVYNFGKIKKLDKNDIVLICENVGDGTILLSINGLLKNSDVYKFIFRKVVEDFSNETKEYIDYRKKTLGDTKTNLEHRLTETNSFYKTMTEKYFKDANNKKDSFSMENKIISMYLNDQNSLMIQLSNNINMLQSQIMGTYNTRAISDIVVSDTPIGPSKIVLMFLMTIASLFFAFFAVFIADFIANLKNNYKKI